MVLFIESIDCECRERVLRHVSSRPKGAPAILDDMGTLAAFAAILDDPPTQPASWEILDIPVDLRPVVRALYHSVRQHRGGGPDVVVVVHTDANRAFESAVGGGKRLGATLADFYRMVEEDPVDAVLSVIPDARVVLVTPEADTLSFKDLWGIDASLASTRKTG